MSTRSGWMINGKHFCETETTTRVRYFIDGKPVTRSAFLAQFTEAKRAELQKLEA